MTPTTATLPQPGSLVDDVMVAAAFLALRADDLVDPDTKPVTATARRTADLLQERSQRLFAYAADLARAEGAPAQTPEAEAAFELCPGCDGPLDGDLFHDDDPNGRPYCAACCPKCIADRAYMDARRAQKDATDA